MGIIIAALTAALEFIKLAVSTIKELIDLREKVTPKPEIPTLDPKTHLEWRSQFLDAIQYQQIEGRLENSLRDDVLLELDITHKPDIIRIPATIGFDLNSIPKNPDTTITDDKIIADTFEKSKGRLLITGEPGAGKTTTLLRLLRHLHQLAKVDPNLPIPVIFDLSTWADKREPIQEWMIKELKTSRYNVPADASAVWVKDNHILPLLDGLDEVPSEDQAEYIQKLNAFGDIGFHIQYAVCVRNEVYQKLIDLDLKNRLELNAAIHLQSLSPEQVDNYLDQLGDKVQSLHQLITTNEDLRQLSQTPLLLNMMVLAYQGLSPDDIDSHSADPQNHLFKTYIDRYFNIDKTELDWSKADSLHYLSWLAKGMTEHNAKDFYIEELQPTWLAETEQTYYKRNLNGITQVLVGLIFGLIVGAIVAVSVDLTGGILAGLISGLIGGIDVWLIGRQMVTENRDNIVFDESVNWSWNGFTSGIKSHASEVLIGALIVGVIFCLFVVLIVGRIVGLTVGMFFGMIVALPAGLSVVLFFGLNMASVPIIPTRSKANLGIINLRLQSLRRFAMVGLTFGLIAGLSFGLIEGLFAGLIVGMFFGMIGGLVVGSFFALLDGLFVGKSPLQNLMKHYTLREILVRNKHLPRKLIKFLDYATERKILVRVGGGYRFIHALLQDYIADLETESPA